MRNFLISTLLLAAAAIPALSKTEPFIGRWDFTNSSSSGVGANWLSVEDKGDGKYDIWFQPTGGHVFQITDYKLDGKELTLTISKDATWKLTDTSRHLEGYEYHNGAQSKALTGVPAPALKRKEPKAWGEPEALFNGKDLSGWEPIGDASKSHWVVKDGLLVNEAHGANLKSTKKFEDFKLHFEVNCPEGANSGFYLRGRYEVQLEYEPAHTEPPERGMGAVYGRVAPAVELERTPGEWEVFDITLVGRIVTISHNGKVITDHKEIAGITGGALDSEEGAPGPFYIQGDHTGGLMFRNITVAEPGGKKKK